MSHEKDLNMRRKVLLAVGLAIFVLAPVTAADKDDGKLDPAKLVGTWTYVSGEQNGKKRTADELKKGTVIITKETITLKSEDGSYVLKYTLDTKKSPARISLEITKGPQGEGSKSEGIIELKDGQLKLCYAPMGGDAAQGIQCKGRQ